jgi:predicted ATPase/DNA-binding SARP family transcriptional activator
LVEFRLLGPLELVDDDGHLVELPAGKARVLLGLLLLEAGSVVSVDRIVDVVWGEGPPSTAAKVVQGYVSRLRKLLPAGVLETRQPGYRLRLGDEQLDLLRFERLRQEAVAAAAEGRHEAAADRLTSALALWRGPALADVAVELRLPGELARLEESRLATWEERIEEDLALGREARLVGELEALVAQHPLRERLRYQLMLTLYRVGRQADALALYRQTRELLVEELGIEPGADLQRLERLILAHDETLAPGAAFEAVLPPLPVALTPLVGRLRELDEVGELLRQPGVRLVTLVGPGGVGKTRLALASAEPRGGVFVSLAPLQDPTLLGSVIASSLGLRDEKVLAEWLRGRELLLVLDNFEHLLEAAPLVTELLAAAPGLRVLATSRAPLNLSGEYRYAVRPLPVSDAADLFVERGAAVGADLGLTASVEEVCRRLDCLPLAIELAAARSNTLTPEQLLVRLERRLPLLVRGPRDLPKRQQTVRATIVWSFQLLEPEAQALFARLAIFAGGCTLEAAEQVCDTTLETLDTLVENSLLQRQAGRYTMLETIREYAWERLDESGETEELARRHAERLLEVVEAFNAKQVRGRTGPNARLEAELANIRATIQWALERTDDPLALRLTAASAWFWSMSGRLAEGFRWVVRALERGRGLPPSDRIDALHSACAFAAMLQDPTQAQRYGEEALALYRAARDDEGTADVLRWLGHARVLSGDFDGARTLHLEALSLGEQLGDPVGLARALGSVAEDELDMGNPTRADELLQRSLELARTAQADLLVTDSLHVLGDVALICGNSAAATPYYVESLRSSTDTIGKLYALAGLAAVAALEHNSERAGRLWGVVEAHEERLGEQLVPANRGRYQAVLQQLAGPAFTTAVISGHELTLDQAVQEAFMTWAPVVPVRLG